MKYQLDSYSLLKDRIRVLKADREKREELLVNDLSKVYAITQSPAPYIKQFTRDLLGDKYFRINLFKIGLNLGVNYLNKILSRPTKGASLFSSLSEKFNLKDETKTGESIVDLLAKWLKKLNQEEQKNNPEK